jgi:glucose-6-phosphate 1-epimerase
MITLRKYENGFEYIEVKNSNCSAKIALQGAHLFEYKRKGERDLLWLSSESEFREGSAIRGGVPLCWPSFGTNNPELPQHGFARTSLFELVESSDDEESTQITLRLRESEESLSLWSYKFELELKLTLSKTLTMELKTTNRDSKPFKLTQALHSYFNISDIADVKVEGLKDTLRFDALTQERARVVEDIAFNQEYDSVFQEVKGSVVLVDRERTISITNAGSSSVVVWNPWIEKCARMSAMSSEAYREFLCIESANAYEDFRVLEPLEVHILKVVIL